MFNLNGNRWLSPDANGAAGGAADTSTTPPADNAGAAAGTQQPAQGQQTPPPAAQQQAEQQPTGITMTQEQLTAKMAAEKNQGRNAVLNELGVKDIDAVKNALALAAAIENSNKTPEQLASDESAKTAAAEARATEAENKLALYKAQAKDEFVGDVLALINVRMAADKTLTFDTALAAVKTTHTNMFGVSSAEGDDTSGGEAGAQQSSGTGVPPGPKKSKGDGTGNYGAMAAAAVKLPEGAKGPDTFFNFTK